MSARHYARLVPATPLPSARCDGSVPRLPGLASPRRGADRGARPGPARPLLVPASRSRRSRFQLPGGGAAPAVLRGAENACSVQSAAPAVRSPRLTPRFGAPACAPRPCASSCPLRTPAAAVGRRPDAPRTARRPPPRARRALPAPPPGVAVALHATVCTVRPSGSLATRRRHCAPGAGGARAALESRRRGVGRAPRGHSPTNLQNPETRRLETRVPITRGSSSGGAGRRGGSGRVGRGARAASQQK